MSPLASRGPSPSLAEHPAFALMLQVTLERFHCTLGEVREDYWLGRLWRALAGDPALQGRVARWRVATVVLTGPGYGAPPESRSERELWHSHVLERITADTGRTAEAWEIAVRWAAGPVEVRRAVVRSLLAQAVVGDPRWGDLSPYAADLEPVVVPVVASVGAVVAA